MVILGVHFDESRMFEVLRLARTYKMNQLTPVVCMLTTKSRLSDVAIEGLDHAVKAMLANAFLNLNKSGTTQQATRACGASSTT